MNRPSSAPSTWRRFDARRVIGSHVRLAARLVMTPAALALALAGCMVGPDYHRPDVDTPDAFRESAPASGEWKPAQPRIVDASVDPWTVFGDPTLTGLVDAAAAANQSIVQADANYRASLALTRVARAALFPSVGLSVGESRAHVASGSTGIRNGYTQDAHSVSLQAAWEPDLWGGVRRSIEAAGDSAQSSEASLAAIRLSIQAQIAQDYLALRINDELRDLLANTVESFQRALQLSQSQFRAGTVSRGDVALATAQLKSTQSLLKDVEATRAQYEHAIAVLLGKPPAAYALPAAPLAAQLVPIPAGLPSELLERRPDIAVAERQAAAANAQIGIAKAAYYPMLTLSAGGGDSLAAFGSFFTAPGRVWTLGASLAQTIFDGGARRARTEQAIANYDASVAQYRQTVLSGFQEVEDNLAVLRVLEEEQATDDEAVAASRDAERIALSQYRAGTTTFLTVITAQNQRLTNERIAVQLRGRRFAASVALIRAIGGGWSTVTADPPIADAGAAANPESR